MTEISIIEMKNSSSWLDYSWLKYKTHLNDWTFHDYPGNALISLYALSKSKFKLKLLWKGHNHDWTIHDWWLNYPWLMTEISMIDDWTIYDWCLKYTWFMTELSMIIMEMPWYRCRLCQSLGLGDHAACRTSPQSLPYTIHIPWH